MESIIIRLIDFLKTADLNSSEQIYRKFPNYISRRDGSRDQAENLVRGHHCTEDSEENRSILQKSPFESEIVPFEKKDLWEAVRKFDERNNASVGPDGFTVATVRKVLRIKEVDALEVFNRCLEERVFPDVWRRANVYEKANRTGGYHLVSLYDHLGKVLERIIYNRLYSLMEKNGRFSDRQYGYRKGRCPAKCHERINYLLAGQQRCLGIRLNVKKAATTMSYKTIIESLTELNVPEYLINLIKSFLTNRRIVYNGHEINVYKGVSLGSPLANILLIIYLNSVVSERLPGNTEMLVYVDDFFVIVREDTPEDHIKVAEESARILSESLARIGLEFNTNKTEAVWLRPRNNNISTVEILNKIVDMKQTIRLWGKNYP